MNIYFQFIIFYIIYNEIKSTPIIFPFKTINKDSSKLFIDYLINNYIYTNINLGIPNQNILSIITFNTSFLYIPGKKYNSDYNEEKSTSFIKRNKDLIYFFHEPIISGFLSNETFKFKNYNNKEIIYKQFPFILNNNSTNENLNKFGILGLKIHEDLILKDNSFTFYLKELNIINDEIFTIKYDKNNDNEGLIIFGEYPHEYEKNKNNFFQSKIKNSFGTGRNWLIGLNNLTYGNIEISIEKAIYINIEIGVIFAPLTFIDYIDKFFFNILIQEQKCFKNIYLDLYIYYVCNDNVEINKFKDLNFYILDLNYTFVLNYKDIFLLYENKFYFLILFDKKNGFFWKFGKPFLKKYQLVFNSYRKTIGFYHNDNSNFNISYFILMFLFILLLLIIVFIIFNKKNDNKKKKHATELIEEINQNKLLD